MSSQLLRRFFGSVITLAAAANLAGCAAVDAYGGRAAVYNDQTADQKSDMVLKNILRAAYNEPLQFTDISSVSGTASSSLTVGASSPVSGIRGTGSALTTVMPSATVSGGPTFNVANLNTQEFYQGIQTPISNQLIANYLAEGVSPYTLYPLAISQIEYNDGKQRFIIRNSATPKGLHSFIEILRSLVNAGITMEKIDSNQRIGSPLTAEQAGSPYLLGHVASALGASQDAPVGVQPIKGSPSSFEFVKKGSQYRFCFDPKRVELYRKNFEQQSESIVIPAKPTGTIPIKFGDENRYFALGRENYCNQFDPKRKHDPFLGLHFTTRSVEGMIYYLGDLANRELGLVDAPSDLSVAAYGGGAPDAIFSIHQGAKNLNDITTLYRGSTYGITPDPEGRDHSSLTLQLVSDFLALQSSAKAFPAPNVITLVP